MTPFDMLNKSMADEEAMRNAAIAAGGFAPGAGLLDAFGGMPAVGGGMSPSLMQNMKQGNYFDSVMQMLGAGGDAAMATGVGMPVGMTMKAAAKAGKAAKVPKMSAADAKAAGYWHPIGDNVKLPIPIGQMTAEREVVGGLMDKIITNPEAMQGNSIIPLTGDRSIAGQNLLGIDGKRFETPVYLEGGYDFMRTHSPEGTVWASEQGRLQGIQNRANLAAQENGGDVFGVYAAMGPKSMNFNVMMADSLLEQMKVGNIPKKAMQAFDKEIKALRPEWKGIMDPESRMQLEANGALRHAFVNRMQLKKFQEAGFPNIAYTRYAITDPLLLNEPAYSSGLGISKLQPGADLVTNPATPHKTYDTQMRGQYVGGLEQSVPMGVMYPEWFNARRAIGAPASADARSFDLAKPIQRTDQQWLDGLMKYMEEAQKPLGY